MKRRGWSRPSVAALLVSVVVLAGGAAAGPATAAPTDPPGTLRATPLPAPTRVPGLAKAITSRVARTDARLLGRTDTTPVPVLVKLDYDPLATYPGNVTGYAATSPSVTGRALRSAPAERRYGRYLAARERDFVDQLRERVPGATVGQRLRTVYGGVSATVPANRVADVA